MDYQLVLHPDASRFLDRVGALLNAQEARFGLLLGLARRLAVEPHAYGEADPWLATVETRGKVCVGALRTPPHKLILAFFGGDIQRICTLLASAVHESFGSIPGILGQSEIADPLSRRWCELSGAKVRGKLVQKIYELTQVRFEPGTPGGFRRAGVADKETVASWAVEFYQDVFGTKAPPGTDREAHDRVDRGEIYLWVDGEPVSMCGSCRPTDHGIAINYVYTPPDKRRLGYGAACLASAGRDLLAGGYRFCVLYADLANPASNQLYRRVGFTQAGDSVQIEFMDPESEHVNR